MRSFLNAALPCVVLSTAVVAATALPSVAFAGHQGNQSDRIVLYFTRHAEKQTVVRKVGPAPDTVGNTSAYVDNCNTNLEKPRCEEELSPLGEKRAELLAKWFERRGITPDITHVASTDKQRTRQTVQPIATLIQDGYGIALPDEDGNADGVWQVPFAGDTANEVNGNSGSIDPTLAFISELPMGSVAVIAGHSGTLYKIFGGEETDGTGGLHIDTTNDSFSFPKKESDGKVPGFGDVWKIVIRPNGNASFKWRKDVDFERLVVID